MECWARCSGIERGPGRWPGPSLISRRSRAAIGLGLFHTYAVPDLPRTNNDLEQLFGSQRYHERRATGRKTAAPGAVLRGSVRLLAATATRVQAPTARDLGAANREHWRSLRQRLERGRRARTLRTRFRHDPGAYLAALEQQACQLALPS